MKKIDKYAIMLEIIANEEIERRFNKRRIPPIPQPISEVRRENSNIISKGDNRPLISNYRWAYFIFGVVVGVFLCYIFNSLVK